MHVCHAPGAVHFKSIDNTPIPPRFLTKLIMLWERQRRRKQLSSAGLSFKFIKINQSLRFMFLTCIHKVSLVDVFTCI